jgi:hypothetical protein
MIVSSPSFDNEAPIEFFPRIPIVGFVGARLSFCGSSAISAPLPPTPVHYLLIFIILTHRPTRPPPWQWIISVFSFIFIDWNLIPRLLIS